MFVETLNYNAMDISMKMYWELYFKEVSTNEIIKKSLNPLKLYESEFVDGAIVDIGCGQSEFLLEYANSGRILYAIDNEQLQLDLLSNRAKEISDNIENWNFLNSTIPNDELPNAEYSVLILSHLLHFFKLDECKEIEKNIQRKLKEGAFIFIKVHSYKHYKNDPEDPERYSYFKHYFTVDDVKQIFNPNIYEYKYIADIYRETSKDDLEFINKWLDEVCKYYGCTDQNEIDLLKQNYLANKAESELEIVLRKKS